MKSGNPCNVCGSTDLNLVDGYYYCVECGTQDATARETIVENVISADGSVMQTFKKKIRFQEDKIEMTGEWYKWHAYNFVLVGLADELIKLGAKPSFKIKLLWVWTRYIKKYQNKEELGLSKEGDESNTNNEETDLKNESTGTSKYFNIKECTYRRINYVTPMLIFTLIYVALNLDKSDIQLYHLLTFLKEERFNVYDVFKYIPKEIELRKIPHWYNYMKSHILGKIFTSYRVRTLALTLFKELDLGYPVIPDIRKLVNNFTTELCLPDDFKQLVFSLIHQYPCEFLNVDQKPKMNKVPDYEGITMAYVLVGLKMCFGLDDDYELKISDIVEKINIQENRLKCYQSDFMETDRLFSFREWINYLQFRKKILLQNCLYTENEHYNDLDDLMFIEYVSKQKSESKMTLEDEITLNILNKMPFDELDVIPKSLFTASLSPLTTYTKVLKEHHKKSDVRLRLSEIFSKYSLGYICEDLRLKDEGESILTGVKKSNKIKIHENINLHFSELSDFKTVFIKNCENKHWMKTKPPSIDHVTVLQNYSKDIESDLGYDSHAENTSDKEMPIISDSIIEVSDKNDNIKLENLREEDENVNIFDDDFIEIYFKEEVEAAANEELEEYEERNSSAHNENPIFSDEEDYNFYDAVEFNPNTFNRERAIKELILAACKNYKVPIPTEYKPDKVPKKKLIHNEAGVSNEPKVKRSRTSKRGEATKEIQILIEMYYNCAQKDVFSNISEQVEEAIRNANNVRDIEDTFVNHDVGDVLNDIHCESDGTQLDQNDVDESEINNEENRSDETGIEVIENLESTLFHEDSDGEINVDKILPKSDAKFDEKNYNIDQLYIKVKEGKDSEENERIAMDISNEPEIQEMLKNKLNESIKNDIDDMFDLEDDLPLAMLKEDVLFQQELEEKRKENNNSLVKNENIDKYYYWLRHYKRTSVARDAQERFNHEARKNLPKNFRFLLNECASMLNCSSYYMYKCLQYLEIVIMSKSSQSS